MWYKIKKMSFLSSFLRKGLRAILTTFARATLFFLGWEKISPTDIALCSLFPRIVFLFSHTSNYDFILLGLYTIAYPELSKYAYGLVKPEAFKYLWPLPSIITTLGCIPSTSLSERNGHAVERITSFLKEKSNFLFLISPKGTRRKVEWRSGWYWISKELDAVLFVGGTDYQQKKIRIISVLPHSITRSLERSVLERTLKEAMSEVVPLYPDLEVVPIKGYIGSSIIQYKNKPSLFSCANLKSFLPKVVLVGILVFFLIGKIRTIWTVGYLFCLFCSGIFWASRKFDTKALF